jgi:hypothetical protein
MAEHVETTDATTDAAASGSSTPAEPKTITLTQEKLDGIIASRIAATKANFGDYDALKEKASKFDEVERAQLSDRERLERERDEARAAEAAAKTEATTATLAATRLQVALEAGLPVEAATRLQGANADELKADAEALAKLLKPAEVTPGPEDGSTPTGHRREDPQGMTRAAIQKLARENPTEFNRKLDAGEIRLDQLR